MGNRFPVEVGAVAVESPAEGRVTVYTRGGEQVWRNYTYPDIKYVGISATGLLTVAGSPDTIHAFNQSGFELWNYTAPGISQVIVTPGNSDIVAASDYTILSLHPSGNLLWSYSTGSEIRDIALSGDGTLIAACGSQIVQIDIHERTFRILAQAPAGVECIALASDGRLYLIHQADLYRLREPIHVIK